MVTRPAVRAVDAVPSRRVEPDTDALTLGLPPRPEEILVRPDRHPADRPLIVVWGRGLARGLGAVVALIAVTALGGGVHALAWFVAVLAAPTFHPLLVYGLVAVLPLVVLAVALLDRNQP